jgi:hypothetical protein
MEEEDKEKIDKIVKSMSGFLKYRVQYQNTVIPIDNNIDLQSIWA